MIYPNANIKCTNARYKTIIASTRKESITMEAHNDANYKIFSDGAGQENGIGSAAMLYWKGRSGHIKTLQAVWFLQNSPEMTGKRVSLYTDNHSIIDTLSSYRATSGQYLINTFRLAANTLGCRLKIRWISGHSKVKGDEAANQLAKRVAAGCSSAMNNLSHIPLGCASQEALCNPSW